MVLDPSLHPLGQPHGRLGGGELRNDGETIPPSGGPRCRAGADRPVHRGDLPWTTGPAEPGGAEQDRPQRCELRADAAGAPLTEARQRMDGSRDCSRIW